MVVVGRTLQGAGTGGLAPIAYVLVKRAFPERPAGRACTPTCRRVGCCPACIAPAIAGTITDELGWRWVFWLLLPLIPVVAFITVRPMRAYAASGTGVVRHSRIARGDARRGRHRHLRDVAAVRQPDRRGWRRGRRAGDRRCRACAGCCRPACTASLAACPRSSLCRILATAAFLGADSFIPLAADRIHGASPTIQGFVIIGAVAVVDGRAVVHRPPSRSSIRAARCGGVRDDGCRPGCQRAGAGSGLAAVGDVLRLGDRRLRDGPAVQPDDGDGDVARRRGRRGSGQQPGQPGRRHRIFDDGRHRRRDGRVVGPHEPVVAGRARHQLRTGDGLGMLGVFCARRVAAR